MGSLLKQFDASPDQIGEIKVSHRSELFFIPFIHLLEEQVGVKALHRFTGGEHPVLGVTDPFHDRFKIALLVGRIDRGQERERIGVIIDREIRLQTDLASESP